MGTNSKEALATSIERHAQSLARTADVLPGPFKRAEHRLAKALLSDAEKVRRGGLSIRQGLVLRAAVRERVQLVKLMSRAGARRRK
jgi:hypothetical protein